MTIARRSPAGAARATLGIVLVATRRIARALIAAGAVAVGPASAQDGVSPDDPGWAFRPPVRPDPPAVADGAWVRNPIDGFVQRRLVAEGLRPSPEADPAALCRRLYLDLIGLLPTPAELLAFERDERPDRCERLVEELLASPHYGERWARPWLDLARYADTNGYEKDRPRSIWPYRDWVIDALNRDMPFDEFTIEQIAGDLLPGATRAQRVATGFHRNSMLNEEGGIDVEEYRYHSIVDRVNTTATTWLGLTVGCAQCHDHKYDPITQREYYRLLAFLDNADEPAIEVPDEAIARERARISAEIAELERGLADRFPLPLAVSWRALRTVAASSAGGAVLSAESDGSILAGGPAPATDTYEVVAEVGDLGDLDDLDAGGEPIEIAAFRLETLADGESVGPGRTAHGNFVVRELTVEALPDGGGDDDGGENATALRLCRARADFAQDGYDVASAIDGDPSTGWAVHDPGGRTHQDRTATFELEEPLRLARGARLRFTLEQGHGGRHTLRRFRLSAGVARPDAAPPEERRAAHLAARFAAWQHEVQGDVADWHAVAPTRAESLNGATMEGLGDGSVLVRGDMPQRDDYLVECDTDLERVTALRLEVLTHASLPDGGPGRAPLFSIGDFFLSEVSVEAGPRGGSAFEPVAIAAASHSYAHRSRPAADTFDGSLETGWSIQGRAGEPHWAVFELAEPVVHSGGARIRLTLKQTGIHQMTIGRFRLSFTGDAAPVRAARVPAEIEAILAAPAGERGTEQRELLLRHFLSVAPELAQEHQRMRALRRGMPSQPTTLVFEERRPEHARRTHLRLRGEFLKRGEVVEPGVPQALHPLPEGAPRDRLGLARWLCAADNPLVARVAVNRQWRALFGRGLVETTDDFGARGARPSHPELLDWLATELVRRGWSTKAIHRLIVTSATYRQSSSCPPALRARDPHNELLARGPRFRVPAETVRDIALCAAGLLDRRIGGESVFPPQPDGVTDLSYGAMEWRTSEGPDRYRRGLYTFQKRTTPYAAFALFDAPSGETSCARRDRTNTPLQALTLLNDAVFVEAARVLGERILDDVQDGGDRARIEYGFRRTVGRLPRAAELDAVLAYLVEVRSRLAQGELDAARLAGAGDASERAAELAAWASVARCLLNLDETVTKG